MFLLLTRFPSVCCLYFSLTRTQRHRFLHQNLLYISILKYKYLLIFRDKYFVKIYRQINYELIKQLPSPHPVGARFYFLQVYLSVFSAVTNGPKFHGLGSSSFQLRALLSPFFLSTEKPVSLLSSPRLASFFSSPFSLLHHHATCRTPDMYASRHIVACKVDAPSSSLNLDRKIEALLCCCSLMRTLFTSPNGGSRHIASIPSLLAPPQGESKSSLDRQ